MADKKPKDEDEAQSRRFIEAATDLEAAGELNLTDAEEKFERLVGNSLPIRKAPEK